MLCILQENVPSSALRGRCAWPWVLAGATPAPAPTCPAPPAPPPCLTTALPCAPLAVSGRPRGFRLSQQFSVGPAPCQKRPRRGAAARGAVPCRSSSCFALAAICRSARTAPALSGESKYRPAGHLLPPEQTQQPSSRTAAAAACAPEAATTKNTGKTEEEHKISSVISHLYAWSPISLGSWCFHPSW